MYNRSIKRILDIVLAVLGLVLTSWAFLLIAAAIEIDDPGRVFFTQKRVGRGKKYFKLYKFRSMKADAPHDVPTHLLTDTRGITRVGRFLRRTSLDELPQLVNILKGDMSFIGPRPALWNQDDLVAERDKYGANDVRPGLSGLAQISGRDELEIPEKARLDGEYVKNMSFALDCRCFFGSFISAIRGEGIVEGNAAEEGGRKSTRVVILCSHTPSLIWFRADMIKAFIARGCEVVACGNEPEEKWRERFAELGAQYRRIFVKRNGANPFADVKTYRSVKRTLHELKPDKLFTFQAKTVIYGGLAARRLKIKEVYPLIAGAGSIFMRKDLKTRCIRALMKAEYRAALRGSRAVFFQNGSDVELFRSGGMISGLNVVMLHGSGVNTKRFTVTPLPDGASFLCTARLIRDKGVMEYLEASKLILERIPGARCMLVGPFDTNPSALKPGDIEPYIKAGVEYFGFKEDVRPYLAQCSVFVLPSYREGTPKTVLEAMACGRAVITTDAPGCRETVKDGVNGLLVPVKDVKALAEAMERLAADPAAAAEMGAKGRILAEEIFDVDKVNDIICGAMGI
ncbi:MAG: sugar transferase [Clostridia bacterium]|nr:sugar transferase [Clostridia bacterium]